MSIFLDISGIKDLTTDGILYILSSLEYSRLRNLNVKIVGNNPIDDKCNKIFETSGFYKYVYSIKSRAIRGDAETFSIESDSVVMPGKAASAKEFTRRSLLRNESTELKRIYTTLIECMANTKQHAYKKRTHYSKWWLMASHDKELAKVHFTFLDNGLGIPSTIRMRFSEKIRSVFGKIVAEIPDSDLISSSLSGDFRTRTGMPYRGKGLPSILETAKKQQIDNLRIISKKGYVGWERTESGELVSRELKFPLFGTLLSWDFV